IDSKETLAKLYVFSKDELQEQGLNIDSLQKAVNATEKRLSENSKTFAQFMFSEKIEFGEVKAKLKTDEALVEIIRLRNFDQVLTDNIRYIAFVISKNNQQPVV
ncbi:MAG TPA: hypothetical protein PLR98_04775, partial [Chitinophagaceae bacterium]|nr:hypothetical protein [Chitinophagaceae bacterium]